MIRMKWRLKNEYVIDHVIDPILLFLTSLWFYVTKVAGSYYVCCDSESLLLFFRVVFASVSHRLTL